MLYLLYFRHGLIRKFPLPGGTTTIGRSVDNDFYFNESHVSKRHARIEVGADGVQIEDLGSTNGTFVDGRPVRRARLSPNQSFRIGHASFVLKEGNGRELVLSEKVRPILDRVSQAMTANGEKTHRAINLLYSESLAEILHIGFRLQQNRNIFQFAESLISQTLRDGCLALLAIDKGSTQVVSQWNFTPADQAEAFALAASRDFARRKSVNALSAGNRRFCSFPVSWLNLPAGVLYLGASAEPLGDEMVFFLETLADEVSLIDMLIEDNQSMQPRRSAVPGPEIITANPGMLHMLAQCKKIAQGDLFVLVEGETGTGKELIARLIHALSPRGQKEFVALNCAAIPEQLMEAELFGHEKGAFTDACTQRKGKLEVASGGTLVLDEIGDMPLNLQAKLLRAIQESRFYRVGGNAPISVDLRIIALTNQNIRERVENNLFRQDLYFRIAHVVLKLPPLRQRKEDIVPLINHFTSRFAGENRIFVRGFSQQAIRAMEVYGWPGNVRELENEIRKVLNLSDSNDIIDVDLLKEEIVRRHLDQQPPRADAGPEERELILALLAKHKWNKTKVAQEMGISRVALYGKLKKYGV